MQNKALLSKVALIGIPGIYQELLSSRKVSSLVQHKATHHEDIRKFI